MLSCSIDGTTVSLTLLGQNDTLAGQSSPAKAHQIRAEVIKYTEKCTYRRAESAWQENTRVI